MDEQEHDMPCGRCDVGLYSYAAALTPLAHQIAAQSPEERVPPTCKTHDRACVGACHFIAAINKAPEEWECIRAEAASEGVPLPAPPTEGENR